MLKLKPATRHKLEGFALVLVWLVVAPCYWLAARLGRRRRRARQLAALQAYAKGQW